MIEIESVTYFESTTTISRIQKMFLSAKRKALCMNSKIPDPYFCKKIVEKKRGLIAKYEKDFRGLPVHVIHDHPTFFTFRSGFSSVVTMCVTFRVMVNDEIHKMLVEADTIKKELKNEEE